MFEVNPKTVVMEYVPGIRRGIQVIDALAKVLFDGGWSEFDALRESLTSMHGAVRAVRGGK